MINRRGMFALPLLAFIPEEREWVTFYNWEVKFGETTLYCIDENTAWDIVEEAGGAYRQVRFGPQNLLLTEKEKQRELERGYVA